MDRLNYNNFENQSQVKKMLVEQHLNEGIADIQKRITLVSNAFYSNLIGQVTGWVKNAKCQVRVNNIFRVKSQSKAYTAELIDIVSSSMKAETQTWINKHFIPLLKNEIETLSETLDTKVSTYLDELEHLKVTLNLNQHKIIDNTTPSTTNRVLSSGASLLVGDIGGAIMGGAGGFDATLKTLGCEFGAGLVLGIASLFTPIGLTAIVISVVLSAMVGGKWALSSIEENISKEITKEIVKNLKSEEQKNKFNQIIISNVDKSLSELKRSVNTQWERLSSFNAYEKAC